MSPLTDNRIFTWSYDLIAVTFGGPAWLAYFVASIVVIMVVVNGFLLLGTLFTWMERKVVGRFQSRVGPNRVGPFGILQAVADAIKLLFKEDIVPRRADRLVFNAAPIVMLAPSLMALAVIPFGAGSYVADLNVAVLYIAAMSGIASLAVMMAGYASSNKLALLGSMRAVAMLISYEIPLMMALLGITILAGSMSMVDIVEAQGVPFLLVAPLGALIFLIAISAELNRPPFDITEAESELVAGYLTEYSGMKFGVFYLAEFSNVVLAGALFAVLFLDGWKWPVLPSHLWFLIKVFGFLFVASWVRATLPRMRLDQVLAFAWKYLFPLSLVNVLALAVETVAWPDPSTMELWMMVAINWVVAVAAIPALSLVLKVRAGSPRTRADIAEGVR